VLILLWWGNRWWDGAPGTVVPGALLQERAAGRVGRHVE
jgi:hypothetical protein